MSIKVLATNKKAYHEYHILESIEAGIALQGTEVKSLRDARTNLGDGWVEVHNGEMFLRDVQISPYTYGNRLNHSEKRTRKLLLNQREITKLSQKIEQKGMSLIPTKIYLKGRWIKVEIAVAKGKKDFDKREAIKKHSAERDIARALRHKNR
jgi:SsrA-binding protein